MFRSRPAPLDQVVLRMDGVTKEYAEDGGVTGVDLEVRRGCILGLVGPSGAGKTTIVRLLLGLLAPDTGSVRVLGSDPREATRGHRRRIGYLPQHSVLYPTLSARANLDFVASLYDLPWRPRLLPTANAKRARARLSEVIRMVGLEDRERHRLGDLSGGEQRRLALAAALVHSPELLLLDEPTAGIDPVLRQDLWEHFGALRDEHRTLVVTTQYVTEAAYCDLVAVVVGGRILHVATPEALQHEAFGGAVLDLEFSRPLLPVEIEEIGRLPRLERVRRAGSRDRLRAVVPDAETAEEELARWSAEHDVEVATSTMVTPSFDDVFVELVERHRDGDVTTERSPA